MHIYKQLKNGDITLSQLEEDQRKFKSELNEITSGNPDHKKKSIKYNKKC